jgi:hypothetical protein
MKIVFLSNIIVKTLFLELFNVDFALDFSF